MSSDLRDRPVRVHAWPLQDEPPVQRGRERHASVLEHLAYRLRTAAGAHAAARGLAWLDSGGPLVEPRCESILTAFPLEVRRLDADATDQVPDHLDGLVPANPGESTPGLGFQGGWIGFLGYRAVAGLEPVRISADADVAIPLASFALHPVWFRHDRVRSVLELWSRLDGDVADVPAIDAWRHWAEDAVRGPFDLTTPMLDEPAPLRPHPPAPPEVAERLLAQAGRSFDATAFRAAVDRVKGSIREGEVFQANIAHRVRVRTDADPFSVFIRLRRLNPSPFACFIEEDWGALVSNSPERLFCVRNEGGRKVAHARPIAGTRPRYPDPQADARSVAGLVSSAKERAEHTMLVDLARNDLGRIAEPGSVRVAEYQRVEPYSHVHHLVSAVSARVRDGTTPADLFRALFPGGTITGAPKLRSVEVIDTVEPVERGPYTGSAGYVNPDGTMDLSILIRTLVRIGDLAWLWAGAGIVADSDPEAEYEETMHKAQAMLVALATVEAERDGLPAAPLRGAA